MPIPKPSIEELQTRIYNRLKGETGIDAGLHGSVAGAIVKVIAAELNLVWDTVDAIYRQSNISTAFGPGLDAIGALVGVARRPAQQASTIGFSKSVRFTNLGQAQANIPIGTRVWNEQNPQVAFFTTEGLILSPGESGFVHVRAAGPGEFYNVPARTLTKHNAPNVNVSVINVAAIDNGSLRESDDSYRERIIQEFQRRNTANVDSIIALVRNVPGVRDAWVTEFERGAGTFGVTILPYDDSEAAELVARVSSVVQSAVPIGISAQVRPPVYRPLDVKINIRFSPQTGTRQETIRQRVRGAIASLVDNLPVEDGTGNGSFFLSNIRSTVQFLDGAILDASVQVAFEGAPFAEDGVITVSRGERIILRNLIVT
jgi:uncharacterized phage protein gp47/JayE